MPVILLRSLNDLMADVFHTSDKCYSETYKAQQTPTQTLLKHPSYMCKLYIDKDSLHKLRY